MSRDLNVWHGIGRIGKPLELKYSQSGTAILNFSIACGDDYTDKQGQKVEQTNWINIVSYGKQAEVIAQYCDKGSQLFCQGKQVTRKWQDQSGNDRWTTEIKLENFQFLGGKTEGNNPARESATTQDNITAGGADLDDIPFSPISSKLY